MNRQSELPASAQRVADLLRNRQHAHPVVILPASGRTSAEAAAALGCSVAEIAKSIVFRCLDDDSAVLVITSGANRVDENKVAALVGALGKADAAFVRAHTGYAIGGVCPIGHLTKTTILIDQDLFRFAAVWAAAGHPHPFVRWPPRELRARPGGPPAGGAPPPPIAAASIAGG